MKLNDMVAYCGGATETELGVIIVTKTKKLSITIHKVLTNKMYCVNITKQEERRRKIE